VLPPSGAILHALARFDPLPSIAGPNAPVKPPTRGILATAGVRHARASVVRILGTACGLGVEGSGWVAGADLVVTNAHVVAGESDTVVQRGGTGQQLAASALVFDPHDDIAVLHVPGLGLPPVALARTAADGTAVAILGYPEDGPFDEEPGRIGQTQDISTEDAYGQGPVTRSVTPLRGRVRPGNSGGPLIDATGHVLGTVFAATTGTAVAGGLAVPEGVARAELHRALAGAGHPVSTGPCAE